MDTEVAIVGGGVAGCATALYLARREVPVVLLEKGDAGAQASGVNFGGVRQQGRHLSELPLSRRARSIWPRLREIVGDDCEFAASGHLKLASTDAELAALTDYAGAARDHGLDLEVFDGGEARRRFPWLSGAIAGASFCAEDGQANPRLVGPAFARAARAAGAAIHETTEVIGFAHDGERFHLRTTDGGTLRARQLVNTAGAWGGRLAAAFGEDVPLDSIAPQMVVSEPVGHFIEPVLGMCGAGIYLRQIARGNVIFGGGNGIGRHGGQPLLRAARAHPGRPARWRSRWFPAWPASTSSGSGPVSRARWPTASRLLVRAAPHPACGTPSAFRATASSSARPWARSWANWS